MKWLFSENENLIFKSTQIGILLFGFSAATITSSFITAPYGKYASKNWGPSINAKLGWIIQESPSFIVSMIGFFWDDIFTSNNNSNNNNTQSTDFYIRLFLISLYWIHYFNRSFIYPLRMSSGSKPTPLITVASACLFCTANGYIQGREFGHFSTGTYPSSWWSDPRFLLGVMVYVTGFVINQHADHILRNLRRPNETGYKIPRGGMFRYVSAANYFGEIVEWSGYAIASWNMSTALFAVFTSFILIPRGRSYHRWYLEKFREDYSTLNRSPVIPFLC